MATVSENPFVQSIENMKTAARLIGSAEFAEASLTIVRVRVVFVIVMVCGSVATTTSALTVGSNRSSAVSTAAQVAPVGRSSIMAGLSVAIVTTTW